MESSDGFRRRAAITVTPNNRNLFSRQLDKVEEITNKSNHSNYVKFKKINQNKHSILKNRKREQEFHKIIESIENRRCTFYRMGFKSFQKEGQRKVFADVLGLASKQMKGTMFVGQLWANQQVSKFMKQNNIHMSKLKLMDKLQIIKKQYDDADKCESESQIAVGSSCRSIDTFHTIPVQPEKEKHSTYGSINKITASQNLDDIRRDLKLLKKKAGRQSLHNEIAYLQRCKEKMQHVEHRYFMKMIQLQ